MKDERSGYRFQNGVFVSSYGVAVGKKEGEGPLKDCFPLVFEDDRLGENSFEKAESRLQKEAMRLAFQRGHKNPVDLDVVLGGDLLNQCIATHYGIRDFEIPFLGLYGACSNMAESLLLASLLVDGGYANLAAAVTSSHFCTAERQFRFPLGYGSHRPPTSQWTATAAGAVFVGREKGKVRVTGGMVGKITDLGVCDLNNMGAAMAPENGR